MVDQKQIDQIIETFKGIFEQAKAEIAPLLKKEAWKSWAAIKANADTIMAFINEVAKMLIVAKETVVGEDGKFEADDVDALLQIIGIKINELIDIPAVPEWMEQKIIDFALHAAYQAAAKKIKVLPTEFASYKTYAEKVTIS